MGHRAQYYSGYRMRCGSKGLGFESPLSFGRETKDRLWHEFTRLKPGVHTNDFTPIYGRRA